MLMTYQRKVRTVSETCVYCWRCRLARATVLRMRRTRTEIVTLHGCICKKELDVTCCDTRISRRDNLRSRTIQWRDFESRLTSVFPLHLRTQKMICHPCDDCHCTNDRSSFVCVSGGEKMLTSPGSKSHHCDEGKNAAGNVYSTTASFESDETTVDLDWNSVVYWNDAHDYERLESRWSIGRVEQLYTAYLNGGWSLVRCDGSIRDVSTALLDFLTHFEVSRWNCQLENDVCTRVNTMYR